MPGTPATAPRTGAPRHANADAVDFAGQVNGVTDMFDSKVVLAAEVRAAAALILANKLLTADAQPAFQINGLGTIGWGPGGAVALDTFLNRVGVGALQANLRLEALNALTAYAGNAAQVQLTSNAGAPAIFLGNLLDTLITRISAGRVGLPSLDLTGSLMRPLVTALPAGYNGQEVLFQTAAMATAAEGPWLLRYDTALVGTSKWRVLGCESQMAGDQAAYSTASTSYTAFGPSVIAAASGIYEVTFGAVRILNNGVATSEMRLSARHGAVMPGDANAIPSPFTSPQFGTDPSLAGTQYQSVGSRSFLMTGVVAGEAVSAASRYEAGGAGGTYVGPWLRVRPVRIG